MGKMSWTDAQRRAIDGRGNILVSAAAGSGKTATLTAKIIALLKSGEYELSQLLIVTFTKAAAGEMRERISRALAEEALVDGAMSRHLRDTASADICTIHSFCTKLLRENFSALGISPSFSVCDDAEAAVMKTRAMESTVDDLFSHRIDAVCDDASIFALADTVGATRDAARLDASLRELYDKLCSMGLDEGFLLECAERLDIAAGEDFFASPWGEVLRDRVTSAAEHYHSVLTSLASEMAKSEAVTEKYMPTARAIIDYLEHLTAASSRGSYSEMQRALSSFDPGRLGSLTAKNKTDASESFKSLRDEIKKHFTTAANRYFASSEEDISNSMRGTARCLRSCAAVLAVYSERYTAMKRERGCLDFADLEIMAYRLLVAPDGTPTEAAREISRKYRFVFIDEYQDTNRVQDSIFRAVSLESEKFFVGDIKQSIYRFRGAEPEVFTEYRELWGESDSDDGSSGESNSGESAASRGEACGRSIFMSENFRCAEPIVRIVNAVSRRMFPFGGIPFAEEDCLVYGGVSTCKAPVELCLLDGSRRQSADEEVLSESEYVAERICELLRGGEYRPSDIAVLLRSANKVGDEYVRALASRGVPARLAGGSPFAEEREVILMLDILRAIDDPLRDIPLAGAMLSSVFGFTLDELIAIRRAPRSDTNGSPADCSVYSSVLRASDGEGALAEKCRELVERLSALRSAERGMSADRFIDHVIRECSLLDCAEVASAPCGRENMLRIRDLALTYESTAYGGLYGFLSFIDEKLAANELTVESSEAQGGVTVISIHKSKGLEFPVCFLAECGKRRNASDERAGLVLHRTLGAAMRLPDESGLVMCGNPIRDAVGLRLGEESAEEGMRVLYVAMTRAVERLFISAKCSSTPQKELSDAAERLRFEDGYSVKNAARMIDHILSAAASDPTLPLKITAVMKSDGAPAVTVLQSASDDAQCERETPNIEQIAENIAFEYQRAHMTDLPSKLAVSVLYPRLLDSDGVDGVGGDAVPLADGVFLNEDSAEEGAPAREESMPLPRFMSGSTDENPAERGSSNHIFLQFADFAAIRRDGAAAELKRLLRDGFMTERMASLVDLPKIERFAASDIVDRFLNARRAYRELRFNLPMEAELFTEDDRLRELYRRDGVKITVQGVFDCVFEDADGRLVLLDYKTDALSRYELTHREAAHDKLRRRHARQVYYYTRAASRIFERELDEVYIYSLSLGECIDMRGVEI